MQVEGRVFVVTGAGNGIGRAVALELVRRGASVVGADLDGAGLSETARLAGDPARFEERLLDIGDREAVAAFPATVVAAYGRVDGLFNVAGIGQQPQTTEEISDERIETLMRVNFYGAVWLTRAFLPHLRERREAVIMFTSSLSAIAPFPGSAVYGASKAALALFGYGMAQDLRRTSDITVTTVLPGTVWTDLVRSSAAGLGVDERLTKAFAARPEGIAKMMVDATLAGRRRVVVGKDAHVFNGLRRLSFRAADKAADLQVGTMFYRR
ncbi:MAG: SDR family oxidoreductase [Nocardioides sp.]|nr:SDR family oxidoreductase [Nocardioides sp.]